MGGAMSSLDEYKELRSEIRYYMDLGQKAYQYAFLILAGVFVAGIQYQDPSLFFLSSTIIIVLWFNKIRCTICVYRVATYIERMIEPNFDELNWETCGRLHSSQTTFLIRFFSHATFPLLILISTTKGILLLEQSIWIKILTSIASLFFIILLYFYSYKATKFGRERERKEWDVVANKVNLNNNSKTDVNI